MDTIAKPVDASEPAAATVRDGRDIRGHGGGGLTDPNGTDERHLADLDNLDWVGISTLKLLHALSSTCR